jgi:hypothetical protein
MRGAEPVVEEKFNQSIVWSSREKLKKLTSWFWKERLSVARRGKLLLFAAGRPARAGEKAVPTQYFPLRYKTQSPGSEEVCLISQGSGGGGRNLIKLLSRNNWPVPLESMRPTE